MPSVNDELLDRAIRHQIGLERYSNATVRKIIALLNRVDADLSAQIQRNDPTAVNGNWSQRRIVKLLDAVRATLKEVYQVARAALNREIRDLGTYEAVFQQQSIASTLPLLLDVLTPTPEQLYAAVHARPFQGALLKDVYSSWEASAQKAVRDAIRMGFVEGETTAQIVRRVIGTKAQHYEDGVLQINRRHAEAVVRTALAHTAAVAQNETYKANAGLIKAVRWTSVLDGRTTAVCRARDGRYFPVDRGPRPPAHWNCRSTTVPVLKSFRDLGFDIGDLPEGTRASMNGQIPASVTYNDWLRTQPREFVEDVLGKTKAKLYLDGKLSLDRFVDRKGKELTLEQLRRQDAEAFALAGV